jgi:hypothetical protein
MSRIIFELSPDRLRRGDATEEEWSDPDTASWSMLVQGVLFENAGTDLFRALRFAARRPSANR